MAHETEKVSSSTGLTSEELKNLAYLLKHPDIRKMADEVKMKEVNK